MSEHRYVVHGRDGVDVWYEQLVDGDWDTATSRATATTLSLRGALRAAEEMRRVASCVSVLAVAEDGTETALPTYEEALIDVRDADAALAALGIPDDGRSLAERVKALAHRGRVQVNLARGEDEDKAARRD